MSKSVNHRRKASFKANNIEILKKRLMIDVREISYGWWGGSQKWWGWYSSNADFINL
jgi:hypothetical protein